MSVISQKYINLLTTLFTLSKSNIKAKDLYMENILINCEKRFINKHITQTYALRHGVKIMVIADIKLCSSNSTCLCYHILFVEAFFTYPKSLNFSQKIPNQTKPYIIKVELETKEKLNLYGICFVKIPEKYKPYCKISRKDCKKIKDLRLKQKHSLHNIIQKNIDFAKKINTSDIQNTSNSYSKDTKSSKSNTKKNYICVVVKKDNLMVAKTLHNNAIIKVKATQKALKELPESTLILVDSSYKITKVLGNLFSGSNDKEIALYAYNYNPLPFSDEVLIEAKNMARSLADIKGVKLPTFHTKKSLDKTQRYDMTHLPFCTIDPINAKDHDDAIYYDSNKGVLYVAISDVSSYVAFNSALDKAAQNNAFSLYFPNQVFPMLPSSLSSDVCSLKPNKNRLALVWILRLHKRTAEILHSQVCQAIICSRVSLNYNQVAKFLENPNDVVAIKKHKEVGECLLAFSKVALLLYKKRMQQGIDLLVQDFDINIDNNENIKSISLQTKNKAHTLVEEAMLLANQASANYLNIIGYGIYRNHANPSKTHFNQLMCLLSKMGMNAVPLPYKVRYASKEAMYKAEREKMFNSLKSIQKDSSKQNKKGIIDFCIVRHFEKANYKIHNEGHFGLGFSCYTHFTSPIRRYSDIIVHRIITAYLQNNLDVLPAIMYKAKCVIEHINEREIQFSYIESYYKNLKMLRYVQSILPINNEALVLEINRGMAYAIPLNKIGFCNIVIHNINSKINAPTIVQVQIVGVDFYSMNLKAKLI